RPLTDSMPAAVRLPTLDAPGSHSSATTPATRRRVLAAYRGLPLLFAPNAGQANEHVRYMAQGAGFGFYFEKRGAMLTFTQRAGGSEGRTSRGVALRLRFLGASPTVRVDARAPSAGKLNYLVGKRSAWRRSVPTYQMIAYRGLWPGIDLVVTGRGGKLKYA